MPDDAEMPARAVMGGFVAAFNARDVRAICARWFYCAHGWLHRGRIAVMQQPEGFLNPV